MKALRFRLDFERIVDIGQMVVGQVQLAHNSEYFWAFDFLLILKIHLGLRKDGSSPKFAYFGDVGVCLEFVGSIFENLVEFMDFDAHIILLYNSCHNSLHLLLFFNETYHKMENIGTDVPSKLLLRLCLHFHLILL